MKPEIKMSDAKIVNNRLVGRVMEHHTLKFHFMETKTGKMIWSSLIMKRDDRRVETMNTIYLIDSWLIDPDEAIESNDYDDIGYKAADFDFESPDDLVEMNAPGVPADADDTSSDDWSGDGGEADGGGASGSWGSDD